MSETQTPTPTPKSGSTAAEPLDAAARKAKEAAQFEAEKKARDTQKVVEKTADASRDAARANREILQRNVETVQEAVQSGLQTGAQSVQSLTQTLSRTFGAMNPKPDPDLADQSARNIRAVSEASTALARGTRDATHAWFDLVQNSVRTNLEAFGELTSCRSMQHVVELQSRLARDNLQRFIESGQLIAQASTKAISEANRAIDVSAPDREIPTSPI